MLTIRQIGYAESFNSRSRDEFLAVELFAILAEARAATTSYRRDYSHEWPHSSLGYLTPTEFAESLGRFEARFWILHAVGLRPPSSNTQPFPS